jgi:hypothetical protein
MKAAGSVPRTETPSPSLDTENLRIIVTISGALSWTASRHMAIRPRSESSRSCRVSASLVTPVADSSRASPLAFAWNATRETDFMTPMMAATGSPSTSPETWICARRLATDG